MYRDPWQPDFYQWNFAGLPGRNGYGQRHYPATSCLANPYWLFFSDAGCLLVRPVRHEKAGNTWSAGYSVRLCPDNSCRTIFTNGVQYPYWSRYCNLWPWLCIFQLKLVCLAGTAYPTAYSRTFFRQGPHGLSDSGYLLWSCGNRHS